MTEVIDSRGMTGVGESAWSVSLVQWLRRYAFAIAAYFAATLATDASWQGDTVDYVDSITLFARGINHNMWDFAHLLWRPAGWILSVLFAPITSAFVGKSDRLNVMVTLMSVSWFAGLLCVVFLHSIVRRTSGRTWIANVVSLAFVFTQTFLNWSQAGSAYIPGFALLLLGFHVLIARGDDPERRWQTPMLAGTALAGAICLWVPYLLATPAAVLTPLVLFGFNRTRVRLAIQTAIVVALVTGVAYLAVMAGLRISTVDEVRDWITSSTHGIDYSGGKRLVFGFARSFLDMSNDGLLFKRYLISDPFNPVSLRDLFGATLVKIGLFYVFVASVAISLFRSPQTRRILPLVILNGVPVMMLAYSFASSEPERYLPLYPALFMAIATCLAGPSRILKAIVFAFFGVMIITNSAAMAKPVLNRKQERAVARIRDLYPRVDGRTMVFVPNYQDELITFSRTYPFDPINRSGRLHLDALVSPGTILNLRWRENFASRTLSTWKAGGEVWLSKRVCSSRPMAEWNWVEGADRRVSWKDLYAFFFRLEKDNSAGGTDGFVRLSHSSVNEHFLDVLAAKSGA